VFYGIINPPRYECVVFRHSIKHRAPKADFLDVAQGRKGIRKGTRSKEELFSRGRKKTRRPLRLLET